MHTIHVFDAYGTLFDVHTAAAAHRDRIGPAWERMSEVWRTKHLEYTWIHSLSHTRATFWTLAERSLAFAAAAIGGVDVATQAHILAAYRTLTAYPEVAAMLDRLRTHDARLAILTNGDADMIADAVASAGLTGRFDRVMSAAEAGVFKPDPRVYRLATDQFGCRPADIAFYSSNRWDIAGAKAAGFATVWINRHGAPDEYPDARADVVLTDLGRVDVGIASAGLRP